MKISQFGQKEWLEICAMVFPKDGVEEMTRIASYFIILFHVSNQLDFPKESSESNPPYLCSRVSLI